MAPERLETVDLWRRHSGVVPAASMRTTLTRGRRQRNSLVVCVVWCVVCRWAILCSRVASFWRSTVCAGSVLVKRRTRVLCGYGRLWPVQFWPVHWPANPFWVQDIRGCVRDLGAPSDRARRIPFPRTAQNFALFFPSPATIFILSSLSRGPLVEFWWREAPQKGGCNSFSLEVVSLSFGSVLERWDPQVCTFGLWGVV